MLVAKQEILRQRDFEKLSEQTPTLNSWGDSGKQLTGDFPGMWQLKFVSHLALLSLALSTVQDMQHQTKGLL